MLRSFFLSSLSSSWYKWYSIIIRKTRNPSFVSQEVGKERRSAEQDFLLVFYCLLAPPDRPLSHHIFYLHFLGLYFSFSLLLCPKNANKKICWPRIRNFIHWKEKKEKDIKSWMKFLIALWVVPLDRPEKRENNKVNIGRSISSHDPFLLPFHHEESSSRY